MKEHIVKIISIEQETQDVITFRVEKPAGYSFTPGQATDVSINNRATGNEKRPFSFTCLNTAPYLEFTIKIYPAHRGMTNELGKLQTGDELIIREAYGAIRYKGKGVFIAGGAGVTPFISILRDLHKKNEIKDNKLLFANKTKADIILQVEFEHLLGDALINILSEEVMEGYHHGIIDENFLTAIIDDFDQNFYLCGPPRMVSAVTTHLVKLGVNDSSIIVEMGSTIRGVKREYEGVGSPVH